MGKIRVATLGDEQAEKKQKQKAEKRRLEKAESKAPEKVVEEKIGDGISVEERKPTEKKKQYKNSSSIRTASKRHKQNEAIIEKTKIYSLSDALDALTKMKKAAFDETVELHINTTASGISGSLTLPHGTGKQTRVTIISPVKDAKAADQLIAEIQTGKLNFDILIATPDAMPKLARVAKILGPKGLMPNPKAGTVTTKPEEVAKKYEGGQMNYKTESKLPVLHLAVGKVSFGKDKLLENIKTAINTVQTKNIKNATLKSTMSAGIKIQVA